MLQLLDETHLVFVHRVSPRVRMHACPIIQIRRSEELGKICGDTTKTTASIEKRLDYEGSL